MTISTPATQVIMKAFCEIQTESCKNLTDEKTVVMEDSFNAVVKLGGGKAVCIKKTHVQLSRASLFSSQASRLCLLLARWASKVPSWENV